MLGCKHEPAKLSDFSLTSFSTAHGAGRERRRLENRVVAGQDVTPSVRLKTRHACDKIFRTGGQSC